MSFLRYGARASNMFFGDKNDNNMSIYKILHRIARYKSGYFKDYSELKNYLIRDISLSNVAFLVSESIW